MEKSCESKSEQKKNKNHKGILENTREWFAWKLMIIFRMLHPCSHGQESLKRNELDVQVKNTSGKMLERGAE